MTELVFRLEAGMQLTPDEIDYLACLEPSEFAEVAALLEGGWEVLEDAPVYWLVPAAWRPEYRTWVEDRVPRIALHTDANGRVVGASPDARIEWDTITVDARAAGLPPPPEKRLWLLRSPWPDLTVADILEVAEAEAAALLGGSWHTAPDVYRAMAKIMAADQSPTA